MSTSCEVIIYLDSRAKADIYASLILQETKRLEKKYSYYSSDSLLFLLNIRDVNLIDEETKILLKRAKKYYEITKTTFDITIATFKDLYQNTNSIDELTEKKSILSNYVGCEHFEIQRNKLVFDNQFTKIDLGGFVKEYAVDRAILILQKHKIKSALVNFGGDVHVIGVKPDKSKFSVGIKNPMDLTTFITSIEIEDEALTTSASYERNYKIEEQIFSHILSKIDMPSRALSVSVVSPDCVNSGVFSTALMINQQLEVKNKFFMVYENKIHSNFK